MCCRVGDGTSYLHKQDWPVMLNDAAATPEAAAAAAAVPVQVIELTMEQTPASRELVSGRRNLELLSCTAAAVLASIALWHVHVLH